MRIMKKSLCLLIVAVMLFSMIAGTVINASAAAFTIQRQWDSKWKSVYVGGRTMYNTACGIFSIVNAVGYLTGDAPDVYSVAVWANKIGAFNTASFGGTDRSTLYPRIQAKYGTQYGFTCDVNGGSGYWATAASSKLKNHLANGGVAIGHVPGHFIAIVGYDSSTNKFHVYDSAPSSTRGTATYGATGLGDCWVTQSRLSTGKLDLDWFVLLSSTGPKIDKSQLQSLIANISGVSHKNYNAENLQALRVAYDAAVVVNNDGNATQAQVDSAAKTLINAVLNTSTKTVLSTGKSYTATNVTRGDDFDDDGKRLTDGSKSNADGGTNAYSGFGASTEIVVDLGSVQKTDTYSAYLAAGKWGIDFPHSIYVEVLVSTDNQNFTKAASSSAAMQISGTGVYDSGWSNYILTATSDKQVDARYVKFAFKNYDSDGAKYIWIDEIEVARYTGSHITDGIYISAVNNKVTAGKTILFTPSYNNGEINSAYDAANLMWTMNLVAKKNVDGSYTVKTVAAGSGDASVTYTLANDEILIAAHAWEAGADDPVGDSGDNYTKLASCKEGDIIYLSGINVNYSFINIGAFISASENNGSDSVGGNNNNVEQLEGGKLFWLTHYEDNASEGAGTIFTEAYTRGSWFLHIAFEPTSIENVYKIIEISDGTDVGDGTPLAIPNGGFVYCLNYGNDYPTINGDGSGTDYTSANCTGAIIDALTWKVGDMLRISGIDTVNKTIPTTTVNKNWYDDGYVCTANYVKYNPDTSYDKTVYENMLWLTHFNNVQKEGAGIIVTDTSIKHSVWNNYYSFAPVAGTNEYELVEISLGASLGTAVMPTLVEGGFIYAINPGNNYPQLNETGDTVGKFPDMPDYTSENCFSMMKSCESWKIGDRFLFGNLDLVGETIPTTTSDVEWYEEEYVCIATYQNLSAVSEEPDNPDNPTYILGDVNNDGKIDQYDYILVKRHYFETRILTSDEFVRGDVNKDETVNQYDYILIARHYFGTFEIKQDAE
ncbi:MAG: hypothetical protein IJY88_07005 [Clostridia bacterium]|nr:hypothetical protein [Clostridia bacterium]